MPDPYAGRLLKSADITRPMEFMLKPEALDRSNLAEDLGIRGIRKLRFDGIIAPDGPSDLLLKGVLGATVVQDCVITNDPVSTRIDEPVIRRFLANMVEPDGEETEMPDDDTAEPLQREIDLAQIMSEALALALPDWPRAEGVEPIEISVTEPGKTPLTDDDIRPFAALQSLRDTSGGKGNGGA